jgi:hypothetical protein
MSDRLQELLRQRALVQQHLAWLDGEIAAASGQEPVNPPPASSPLRPVARPAPPPPSYVASQAAALARHAVTAPAPSATRSDENPHTAAADAILSEYRVEPDSLKTDVRKGCFLYFFGALAFVALVVTGLYYALSARPH